MKGHVPTPDHLVDAMVLELFRDRLPRPSDLLIDPGCGDGPFMAGVFRYCRARRIAPPRILGIENDPRHLAAARGRLDSSAELLERDYLAAPVGPAEFIIGNPPYVSITGLDEEEKRRYRASFETAVGRFDLYILFFEQSIMNLKKGGRLVFVTPEKFEYTHSAASLRRLLGSVTVERVEHVDESSFPGLVTYPTITTITNEPPAERHQTLVKLRSGEEAHVRLPRDGSAWSAEMQGTSRREPTTSLGHVSKRVSCGVATGADEVFVHPEVEIPASLRSFAHPTISGRQLGSPPWTKDHDVVATRDVMLVPYDQGGNLLPERQLGALGTFLSKDGRAEHLRTRTCVSRGGRVWYRFHDNVPLQDMLRPKILCKDITPEPRFWADRSGKIVPRHSVYYIIPRPGVDLDTLLGHLNSETAKTWMKAHCQRAANGFYRLQSEVIRHLPVPDSLVPGVLPTIRTRAELPAVIVKTTRRSRLADYA